MKKLIQAEVWDERYAHPEYKYGTKANDFLISVTDNIPMGRVLCLAEGEGRNAVYLASWGFEVTAVDFSAAGIEKTKRLAAENQVQVETILADLSDYKIREDFWNGIVSIFCHLPVDLRRRVHAGCVKGLRSGGTFVLEAYHPDQLEYNTGGPPVRELLMELEDVREELNGLDIEISREIVREIYEGSMHNGLSATIQILARKP